jgi:hypothetical protein
VRLKDLETSHDLREGNAAVFLPVLDLLLTLGEDDETVGCSLVDDFRLRGISASHVDGGFGLGGKW